jgi:hypothetical protein
MSLLARQLNCLNLSGVMKMISFGLWILGKAQLIFKLLIEHWRIVLVLLMLFAIWHYKSAYETEKANYTEYIGLVKQEAKLQAEKNKIVEANTRKAVSLAVENYKTTIQTLNIDKTKLQNKVSNLYATKTNADYRLASYADRMLLDTTSASSSGKIASDTERLASCRRELNRADIERSIVEEACAVTTADFNLARGWIDGVCSNHQCGE